MKKSIMPLEKVEQKLYEKYKGNVLINKDTYQGFSKKATFKCTICNYEWETSAQSLLQKTKGTKCPKCIGKTVFTVDEVFDKIYKKHNGVIELIKTTYERVDKPALMKCNICNRTWTTAPIIVYRGHGCPYCAHNKHVEYDEALQRIQQMYPNLYFNKNDYNKMNTKITFYCNKCNHKFISSPSIVLQKHGCPKCTIKSMESAILKVLDSKNIFYLHNKGIKGSNFNNSRSPLRPDFYIPKSKLILECDGKTHFVPIHGEREFNKRKELDNAKNKYCKENGICLIRITSSPTKEWGTEKHLTLKQAINLLNKGINEQTGEVDMSFFIPYDFNRE